MDLRLAAVWVLTAVAAAALIVWGIREWILFNRRPVINVPKSALREDWQADVPDENPTI